VTAVATAPSRNAREERTGGVEITIVAHDVGGPGGMERVLGELIAGLLAESYRVTVISRTCRVAPHERLLWARVQGPSRPFPLAYPWFFVIGSLITWRQRAGIVLSTGAIVGNRVDWCAVHFCHHATRGLGLSRTSRRTIAYRLNARISSVLSRAGERLMYRPSRIGATIGVSSGVSAEVARNFPRLRGATIPNGVSLERFQPDPEARAAIRWRHGLTADEPVALFVGREWEGKGLWPAIAALAEAPDWKLLVVGGGDVSGFSDRARSLGVGNRVMFAGVAEDPAPFYSAADAFVLPTVYETFSLVTYEAAAAGLPLLVTPVNGVTDLLRDGESGWFIEPTPSDIARRLRELGRNPGSGAAMGLAARQAAAAFTWQRMVEAYRRLFEGRAAA
jgi:UDP-glucose:(heptosyl)LPS alpha-1,3-glucosyltransferase